MNIQRFGRYYASDFKSGFSRYWVNGLTLALIPFGLYLIGGVFSLIFSGTWNAAPLALRLSLMVVVGIIVIVGIPTSLYGHTTEKRSGSAFLTLPVSTFEKSASMILNAAVVFPFAIAALYLISDQMICLIDSRCGSSILSAAVGGFSEFRNLLGGIDGIEELEGLSALANPLVYLDDIIQISLVFLLGAVCFKKNKIAKTILVLLGFSMFASAVASPILLHSLSNLSDADSLQILADRLGAIVEHPVLIDTISDTLVNLALSVAIFFRVKTRTF